MGNRALTPHAQQHRTVDQLVQRMQNRETLALISDAGTPAISDPGFLLTRLHQQVLK